MNHLHTPTTHLDLVLNALQRFGDKTAFISDGESLTYRQCEDRLGRWAKALVALGANAGDGFGLLSPNRSEVWFGQIAPPLIGGRYTALHPLGSLEDHLHMCREAKLRFLFIDPAFAERAQALLEQSGTVEHVLSFGPCETGLDIHALADKAGAQSLGRTAGTPEQLSWLLYTGGTTGTPKSAMLPERALAQMAMSVTTGWDMPRDRRYLAVAPISHAAGMMVVPTLMTGGTVILLKGWEPQRWLDAAQTHRATMSLLVPTMIYSLLDHPTLEQTDLSSLQTIMYGASPMAPARLIEGIQRLGPIFSQLYGQTECAGIISCLWREQHDIGNEARLLSCGQAMPGARVAILDEDCNTLPAGEAGEICVQGPAVMDGYWQRDDLTSQTIVDGWLHTGDIGTLDDDGFLSIVDRKKDMIVTGGFNVFPREIEDVIMRDPSVASAAVIGVPDDKWGEAVKALVVARPGQPIHSERIIEAVRTAKGAICAPKSIDVLDSLPLTPVGKPDKKLLRAPYWAGQKRRVN